MSFAFSKKKKQIKFIINTLSRNHPIMFTVFADFVPFLGLLLLSFLTFVTPDDQISAKDAVKLASAKFSWDCRKVLSKKPGNVLYSPFSIHTILSMVYQGTGGTTKEALAKALYLSEPETVAEGYKEILEELNTPDSQVTILTANKAYIKTGHQFNKKFEDAVKNQFASEVEAVDFSKNVEVADAINAWVEQKTNNKIQKLVDSADLNVDTHLLLLNAIYFKGGWSLFFDQEDTDDGPFTVSKDESVKVPMMYIDNRFNYKHDKELGAKVIELPFKDRSYSMVIFLPDEIDGVTELAEKLSSLEDKKMILQGLRFQGVKLSLPKFKIEETIDLEEALTEVSV